jgi:hypothetical protein
MRNDSDYLFTWDQPYNHGFMKMMSGKEQPLFYARIVVYQLKRDVLGLVTGSHLMMRRMIVERGDVYYM